MTPDNKNDNRSSAACRNNVVLTRALDIIDGRHDTPEAKRLTAKITNIGQLWLLAKMARDVAETDKGQTL